MCVCDWTKEKKVCVSERERLDQREDGCVCVCVRERLDQGEESVCVCELHEWQALFTAVSSAPETGNAQRKSLEKIY